MVYSSNDIQVRSDFPEPVLIELFTSQGCSSCPPADAALSTVGMEMFKQKSVIPLSYHVDYWDDRGWRDPFSLAEATLRQRSYARGWQRGSVYTPQLIVGGRIGMHGADWRQALSVVDHARKHQQWRLRVGTEMVGGAIHLTARVERIAGADDGKEPFQVLAAVYQIGRSTAVTSGENAGKTLHEDFVVRSLQELERQAEPRTWKGSLLSRIDVTLPDSGAVVFAQHRATLEVVAVQEVARIEMPV